MRLGENYTGQTSIGCRIKGIKMAKKRLIMFTIIAVMRPLYAETGAQGVSYTTGVPAAIGAMMYLKGIWKKAWCLQC